MEKFRVRKYNRPNLNCVCIILATILLLSEAVSLVTRAANSESDFSVFYRTAVLLQQGAGASIYDSHDASNGWMRCIPPAGMALLRPLAWFTPLWAGIVWAIVNLLLVAAAIGALRSLIARLDYQRELYQSVFPWAVVIFLLLCTGSIQVGQLSILLIACWIFALLASAQRRPGWAGWWIAVPATIKLYPVLLLIATFTKGKKLVIRFIAGFAMGILVMSVIVPFLLYGPCSSAMTSSFFRDIIFNPHGRVAESQANPSAVSNQGIDAVLLRYLCADQKFNSHYPYVPHLEMTPAAAINLANVFRICILIVTVGVLWKKRQASVSLYFTMLSAAVTSTTLFLILPGAKSRYAVYTFLGFIPLLASAALAQRSGDKKQYHRTVALIIGCLVLVISLIPMALRAYGFGFLGAILLWISSLQAISQVSKTTAN